MEIKRPLCLFVLLFTVILFFAGFLPNHDKEERNNILNQLEKQTVCLTGCLKQKEVKNGNLIYYLENLNEMQILDQNKSNQLNKTSIKKLQGAVCYIKNKELDTSPAIGSWLKIEGDFFLYANSENQGQFDSESYYYVMGYDFMLFNSKVKAVGEQSDVMGEWLWSKRMDIKQFFENNMDAENASVLSAMLLGDKSNMSTDIKNLYRKNGIAHILAISGLHISLLGMSLYKLLRRCFLPPAVCAFTGIAVIYLFGKMIGAGSSSFRAGCMFSMFLMAEVLNRTYDMLTAMALSALLLLLKEPAYLYYAGFLLSYFAVMGLGILNPAMQNIFSPLLTKCREKLFQNLFKSLISGCSIQIMTFPLILWFYYEFPTYSILLNLMILPFMGALLICAVIGGLFHLRIFLLPSVILLNYYEQLCLWMEKLPMHTVITGRPQVWQIILYYTLLLIFVVYVRNWDAIQNTCSNSKKIGKQSSKKQSAIMIGFACVLIIGSMFIILRKTHREDCIDMLSVGQGDCICIRNKSGNCILMDGGSNDVEEAGKYRLIPYLKYNGISYIDAVFISHAHEDHNSAILELLATSQNEGIRVGAIVISSLAKDKKEYLSIRKEASRLGCRIYIWKKGDTLTCNNISLQCLLPKEKQEVQDENDASLVILMNMNSFQMLFTGDCTSVYEKDMIASLREVGVKHVNCLKAGHHGAKTSTSNDLLTFLCPEVALISCGKNNRYGHPHLETLQKLRTQNIKYYITKETGQISIKVHKNKYYVRCYQLD